MVWAAISGLGKLKLKFISKRMDGREYQQVLTESLVPFFNFSKTTPVCTAALEEDQEIRLCSNDDMVPTARYQRSAMAKPFA